MGPSPDCPVPGRADRKLSSTPRAQAMRSSPVSQLASALSPIYGKGARALAKF